MRWLTLSLIFGLLSANYALAGEPFASEEQLAAVGADLTRLETEVEATTPVQEQWQVELDELRDELVYLQAKSRKHRESGGSGTGIPAGELEEVAARIASLRAELQPDGEPYRAYRSLPVDTLFSARLMESLSTATSRQGDRFTAVTVGPVVHRGEVLIPEGATLEGVVELVDRPESRTDRKAKLILAFDNVVVDGRSHPLAATVVGASEKMETGLGDEKAKMGVGAGIGAVLGAVIGGKKGALAGIILGGSGAILATEGKDVELPRGTVLELRLDRELTLPVDNRSPEIGADGLR